MIKIVTIRIVVGEALAEVAAVGAPVAAPAVAAVVLAVVAVEDLTVVDPLLIAEAVIVQVILYPLVLMTM